MISEGDDSIHAYFSAFIHIANLLVLSQTSNFVIALFTSITSWPNDACMVRNLFYRLKNLLDISRCSHPGIMLAEQVDLYSCFFKNWYYKCLSFQRVEMQRIEQSDSTS